jgi:hypothetical protein
MDAERINRALFWLASWNALEHREARDAFFRAMQDREYGLDALQSAWEEFLLGWNSLGEPSRPDERIATRPIFNRAGKLVGEIRVCQACKSGLPPEPVMRSGLLFCSPCCADLYEG